MSNNDNNNRSWFIKIEYTEFIDRLTVLVTIFIFKIILLKQIFRKILFSSLVFIIALANVNGIFLLNLLFEVVCNVNVMVMPLCIFAL